MEVAFDLPKGAYATVVLREFCKSEQGFEYLQEQNEESP